MTGPGYGLTRRQLDALAFIEQRIRETGKAPTYREMMAGLGLHSTSGIARLIQALVDRGRLRWSWGQLEVLRSAPDVKPRPSDVASWGRGFVNGPTTPAFIPLRGRINLNEYARESM